MTNARLKRAINNGILISQEKSLEDVEEELKEELSVKEAYLRKVYTGTGKSLIQLKNGGGNVTAYWIYPYNTSNALISFYPSGRVLTDDKGLEYILVSGDVTVDCLNLNGEYVILGYCNNGYSIGGAGDITIASGEHSITVNESVINVTSSNLRINGLPYEAPSFIDDLAGADDINDLLEYLVEHL